MKRPTSPSSPASAFFAHCRRHARAAGRGRHAVSRRTAAAAGSMKLQSSTISEETGGGWHLFTTLELPTQSTRRRTCPSASSSRRPPPTSSISSTVRTSRSTTRRPSATSCPTIESQDVDFLRRHRTHLQEDPLRLHHHAHPRLRPGRVPPAGEDLATASTSAASRPWCSIAAPTPTIRTASSTSWTAAASASRRSPARPRSSTTSSVTAASPATQGASAVPQNGDISASRHRDAAHPPVGLPADPRGAGQREQQGLRLRHSRHADAAVRDRARSLAGIGGGLGLAFVLALRASRRRKRQRSVTPAAAIAVVRRNGQLLPAVHRLRRRAVPP